MKMLPQILTISSLSIPIFHLIKRRVSLACQAPLKTAEFELFENVNLSPNPAADFIGIIFQITTCQILIKYTMQSDKQSLQKTSSQQPIYQSIPLLIAKAFISLNWQKEILKHYSLLKTFNEKAGTFYSRFFFMILVPIQLQGLPVLA